MDALSDWPFELSSLNKLNRGKLVRFIARIPFLYFDDIWFTCISGQGGVSRTRINVLPYWPFEISPLNELNGRKRVRFITLIPFVIF